LQETLTPSSPNSHRLANFVHQNGYFTTRLAPIRPVEAGTCQDTLPDYIEGNWIFRDAGTSWDGSWRRGWDSNPRYACAYSGFRDRHVQPLRHLSGPADFTSAADQRAGSMVLRGAMSDCNAEGISTPPSAR